MKNVPDFQKKKTQQISISQLKGNVTHKNLNPLREMLMIKNRLKMTINLLKNGLMSMKNITIC